MLRRQRVAGRFDRVRRRHGGEQRRSAIRRDFLADSARHQLDEQPMQPAHRAGPGAAQLTVALRQQAQHRRMICPGDLLEPRRVSRRDRNRIPVVGIVLVRASRPEHPHPSRQRCGHVQHAFTGGDELLRQQIADTARTLHRPRPVRETGRPTNKLIDLSGRRAHLDRGELHIVAINRDRSVRPLVRIDPDHHRHTLSLPIAVGEDHGGHS